MPEPQNVLHRPRERVLRRPERAKRRWVVAVAGFVGVAALTMPAASGAASFPPRQHTGTVTTLTALPRPGNAAGAVTLVAMATAANGTHPTGWVQFEADGTDIGSPVGLNTSGEATTSAAFTAGASAALSAEFTPASTAYLASAATDTATVDSAGSRAASVSISLTVPPTGGFDVAVAPGTVTLATRVGAARGIVTGMLQAMTVTESRNYLPGWSVTGQASNFTAAGQPVSGAQLGWIPTGTVAGGAKLGAPVAPGHPGLGSAGAVLAIATPGSGIGTDTLSAELMLAVPPGAEDGPFAGTVTITFLEQVR